ncbi:hypothetical protein DOY81_001698, partial [Sarcophaga bullata]
MTSSMPSIQVKQEFMEKDYPQHEDYPHNDSDKNVTATSKEDALQQQQYQELEDNKDSTSNGTLKSWYLKPMQSSNMETIPTDLEISPEVRQIKQEPIDFEEDHRLNETVSGQQASNSMH